MEENNNIDKIFQSAIEDFEINPPAKSWNSLEAELSKKRIIRKRNNFFRFLSIGLLVFLASFTAYKFLSSDPSTKIKEETNSSVVAKNNSTSVSSAIIPTSTPATMAKSDNTVSAAVKQNSPENIEVNTKTMTASTLPGIITPAVVSHPAKINNVYSAPEIKNNDSKISQVQKSDNVAVANNSTLKTDQPLVKAEAAAKETPVVAPVAVAVASVVAIETTTDQNKVTSAEIPENKNVTEESASVNEPSGNKVSDPNSYENIPATVVAADMVLNAGSDNSPALKESAENLSPSNTATENPSSQTESATAEIPPASATPSAQPAAPAPETNNQQPVSEVKQSTFKTIASHLSAEIYYAPEMVDARLSVNNDYTGSASQNLNDYNNSTSKYSFSTGMNLRYDIGKKWSITSGLGYSTFVTTAVYNSIQVISDNDYQQVHGHGGHGGHGGGGHHGHNPHPHGPPNPNNDHHYVIQTPCGAIDLQNEPPHHGPHDPDNGDTLDIKTEAHSTIQFLYIPLTARYQFGKGKLTYFVEAGGALNLVHDDLVTVTVNDSYSEDNYIDGLKTMNVSLLFGAGIQYNFYKGLSTFVKPTMRYSITPINQNNPVNSYPNYLGLGVGFSIHF